MKKGRDSGFIEAKVEQNEKMNNKNRDDMAKGEEIKDMEVEGEVSTSGVNLVAEGVIIPPEGEGDIMESFEIEAGLIDFDP